MLDAGYSMLNTRYLMPGGWEAGVLKGGETIGIGLFDFGFRIYRSGLR